MRQHCLEVRKRSSLRAFLNQPALQKGFGRSESVLVQIYTAQQDPEWIQGIVQDVLEACPGAVVVGSTTMGEVIAGRTRTGTTAVSITLFQATRLVPLALEATPGRGALVGGNPAAAGPDLVGVLLLATSAGLDMAGVLERFGVPGRQVPVFGGVAGDYKEHQTPLVFLGSQLLDRGLVAVGLYGTCLRIQTLGGLGWMPLGPEMTITDAEGLVVHTVDGAPAFQVYQHYLGLKSSKQFLQNAIEFPFLLQRQGERIARSPARVEPDGSLGFFADLHTGDTFRLGYGDPARIREEGQVLQKHMRAFGPQALFMFSCICRRLLLQRDVDLETTPFQEIAPTVGFYTFGEILGPFGEVGLLNCTQVVVGLREDGPGQAPVASARRLAGKPVLRRPRDPYLGRHANTVARLVHFASVITRDLERSNLELEHLSVTDKLTQLNNRARLDAVLQEELDRAHRYGHPFSVILLDLDRFKEVNDRFGHSVGDDALVGVAEALRSSIRATDVVGRWGGEEFIVVLPETGLESARQVAEKIRETLAQRRFPAIGRMTASLGVAAHELEDGPMELLARADEALYRAKELGRNRVMPAFRGGRPRE